MYHIKSDRRSQSSAAEIVRGLERCLKKQPLNKVTVSDIYRMTGISRSTFYRLFDTTEDVLCYQLERMMETASDIWDPKLQTAMQQDLFLRQAHHEFLVTLIENGRFDLLLQYTEKAFRDLDARYGFFPEDMAEMERSYIMVQLSMNIVASLIIWDRSGRKESLMDQSEYLYSYIRILRELFERA